MRFLLKNTSGGLPIRHPASIPKDAPIVSLLLNTVRSPDASPYVFPKATNLTRHVSESFGESAPLARIRYLGGTRHGRIPGR